MTFSTYERDILIRALTKVLEIEAPYARADEYKKLLDRLQEEQESFTSDQQTDIAQYDIDEP